VTPAGIPPAPARVAAADAAPALAGADAGAGAEDVDELPPEQAPSAAAATSNQAGRAREL